MQELFARPGASESSVAAALRDGGHIEISRQYFFIGCGFISFSHRPLQWCVFGLWRRWASAFGEGEEPVLSRLKVVGITFRCLGAVILFVAVLHLYATILVRDHVLSKIKDSQLRAFVSPGFLLDHVVVGIFMLPIGFLMLWSYRGLRSGQRWAYVMNWSFSLSVLATPFAIGVLMTGSEFRSPAFAVAAVLMGVVGIVSCAVLLWARTEFAS